MQRVHARDRAPLWQASIAGQGVPLGLVGDSADGFAEPTAMLARMDALGVSTLLLPVCELPSGADARFAFERYAARPAEIATLVEGRRPAASRALEPRPERRAMRRSARGRGRARGAGCVGLHLHTHSWDRALDHATLPLLRARRASTTCRS